MGKPQVLPDVADILRKLDFNAVHSGDAIARAYFDEAAAAIRVLQREADYWRRQCALERSGRLEAGHSADALADILSRIVTDAEMEDAISPTPALAGGER